MKTDDATIIAQILAGETKEFRHLMRRHGGTLLACIESVIGSREEAEDIVQETFINAFRSLRQYDDSKASFATWLHRIAYHEALRRMKRRRLPTLSWDEDESLLKYAEEADTDDWLTDMTEEQMQRLDKAIDLLPEYDQMLLRLYYEDDMPLKEIAYILDSEASILASRLRRMKERRPMIELPKEVEDRVMERISTMEKVSAPRVKAVQLWILRAMSAAAAIACIFFLVETMIPEEKEEPSNVVAKVEVPKPVEPEAELEKEQPKIAEVNLRPTQRKKPTPKTKTNVVASVEDVPLAEAEADVCIDCEMAAMDCELTAMINEFENQ